MSETKDGGPAFPFQASNAEPMDSPEYGMSKRELIATHVLSGIATASGYQGLPWDRAAEEAVKGADALIAALSRTSGE